MVTSYGSVHSNKQSSIHKLVPLKQFSLSLSLSLSSQSPYFCISNSVFYLLLKFFCRELFFSMSLYTLAFSTPSGRVNFSELNT